MADEIIVQATEAAAAPDISTDINDWGDLDIQAEETDVVDEAQTDTPAEETTPEADKADQAKAVEGEADKATVPAEKKAEENQTFELKYLGETKAVSRDEIIPLAQKGMDYDRIRAKLDEVTANSAKSAKYTSFLDGLAKGQGLATVEELIDNTNAQLLMNEKPDKYTFETALERVKLDREKAEIAETKAKLSSEKTDADKSAQDIREFAEKFPNVKPDEIPPEVWKEVKEGKGLANAYEKYTTAKAIADKDAENARLKAELEAAKKTAENKERSTGSRTSAGNSVKGDPWLADLESRL